MMMEVAQEKPMDSMVLFKRGTFLEVDRPQKFLQAQPKALVNLLAVSNRFGYVFYATENTGFRLIASVFIDEKSKHLSKAPDDDDDETESGRNSASLNLQMLSRPYLRNPSASSLIPYWISLNAHEEILSLIVFEEQKSSLFLILYDVAELIQSDRPNPICKPKCLASNNVDLRVVKFSWNPKSAARFAMIDTTGTVTTMEFNHSSKTINELAKLNHVPNQSSSKNEINRFHYDRLFFAL